MPRYPLRYELVPCERSAAFPTRDRTPRPIVPVVLTRGSRSHSCYAIIDSGADDCMFPASYAEHLGLDLARGKPYEFDGAGSSGHVAYFFDLQLVIPVSPPPVRYRTLIGFTSALDGPGIGLLGQNGFFDRFKVTFDLPKGLFVLSPVRQLAKHKLTTVPLRS